MKPEPDLLSRLPYPLAQVYLRARNAKSVSERHHNAYYLLEATVKFLASTGVQVYLGEKTRDAKIDAAIKNLALPSTGQWVQILRNLATFYSSRVDAPSHMLGDWSKKLTERVKSLSLCASFAKKVSESDGFDLGFGESLSPLDIFDLLPAYRNKHLGHGAVALESFYRDLGPLLLDAAEELLGHIDTLPSGGELVFAEEKRELEDGSIVVERIRLMGGLPMRLDADAVGESAPSWYTGKLHISWGTAAQPLCLFPLLHGTWSDEQAEVFFLNRSSKSNMPEFLGYTSGKSIKGEGFEEDFRAFFGKVTGTLVDSGEVKRLREKSASDSPGEAEPISEDIQRLVGFKLFGELGKGGMGIVYLAEQETLHRFVALKTLPFEKGRDPVRQARFLREIQSLSKAESPEVVKILDSGDERGVLWYAMELVDGVEVSTIIEALKAAKSEKKSLKGSDLWAAIHKTLQAERNRRRILLGLDPLPDSDIPPVPDHLKPYQHKHIGMSLAVLMQDAAKALQHIHEQERPVIHRDIKPTNLMVTVDGHLVLMDFGLARVQGATTLTVADSVLGTIRYAPPEQIKRMAKVDARADIYSLGATFYELATLGPLYDTDSEVEMISKITDYSILPVEIVNMDNEFPDDFSIIVKKCIYKDTNERYCSSKELTDDIQRFLNGNTILARKASVQYVVKIFARKYKVSLTIAGIFLLLLVIVVFTNYLLNMQERKRATARYLISNALLNIDNDNSTAYLAAALREDSREALSDSCKACFRSIQEQIQFPHMVLSGHSDNINKVSFSPDGHLLASSSKDGTIRVWDLLSGGSCVLNGHLKTVSDIAFSPDGSLLASASWDKTIQLWNTKTWKSRALIGHNMPIRSIAFSPDGALLASITISASVTTTATEDTTIRLWDVGTGESRVFKGHEGWINNIIFSPRGDILASASMDKTVILWDVITGHARVLKGHENQVVPIAFSPDGTMLASGSMDKTVRLWNVKTGEGRIFMHHLSDVSDVVFSPGGNKLASSSFDNTILLRDISDSYAHVIGRHEGWIWHIVFSPDGELLASVSEDKTIRIWNLEANEVRILRQKDNASAIAFSPVGCLLASGSQDLSVRLWPIKKWKSIVLHSYYDEHEVNRINFSKDGLMLAGSAGKIIVMWDLRTGKAHILKGHSGDVMAISFSPDGTQIASASMDKTVRVWDIKNNSVSILNGHEGYVTGIAFSPDGVLLASASEDKTVRLWDLKTGAAQIFNGHQGTVISVAFSQDGAFLASSSEDKTIRVWSVKTKEAQVFTGHEGYVTSIAFSRDGAFLASSSEDKTVRLWDLKTSGSRILKGHKDSVWAVFFSPNGEYIASTAGNDAGSSDDGTVKIWNIKTGKFRTFKKQDDDVRSLAISPDWSTMSIGSLRGAVRLWDINTNDYRDLLDHTATVGDVTFSPDGSLLASASMDATIRIWTPLPKLFFPKQKRPVWLLSASIPVAEIIYTLESLTNLRYDSKTDTVKPLPFKGIPKEWQQ